MKFRANLKKFYFSLSVGVMTVATSYMNVFAETDYGQKDLKKIADIISNVFQKIGILVIFVGGIQIAWAMSSDNPEMKGQALKLIAAGILVVAMATAYPLLTGK